MVVHRHSVHVASKKKSFSTVKTVIIKIKTYLELETCHCHGVSVSRPLSSAPTFVDSGVGVGV
jgi:hypothetical protein